MVLATSLLCPGGGGKEETIKDIFLGCEVFSNVWNGVCRWLGIVL